MRLIYWILAIIEIVLFLAIIIIFILADSRTVKIVADSLTPSTAFSYTDIEGNLFTGLKIKSLKYENRKLFNSATLHWNPWTLGQKKITLNEIDFQEMDIANILYMKKEFTSKGGSKGQLKLPFSLEINRVHFDIKPYRYENILFSSFLLETEDIEIGQDLSLDTKALYLYFDSDLGNVEMAGKIDKNRLSLERLNVKEIDTQTITKLTEKLKRGKKVQKTSSVERYKKAWFNPIKSIDIKEFHGTVNPFGYDSLTVDSSELVLFESKIDLVTFAYDTKNVQLRVNSNIVNLDVDAELDREKLYVNTLNVDELDSTMLLALVNSIKEKRQTGNVTKKTTTKFKIPNIKEIEVREARGTVKDFSYEILDISNVNFLLGETKVNLSTKDYMSEKIEVAFDSNLVNLKLDGKIVDKSVLIERLDLEEIDSKLIRELVILFKERRNRTSTLNDVQNEPIEPRKALFKSIEIKEAYGTLKDVNYGHLDINNTRVMISDIEVDPLTFKYSSPHIDFSGETNFGLVNLAGDIKESTIHSEGEVLLSQELFDRYHLPLNYENLRRLPSHLTLDHHGLWLDVKHKVDQLLVLENDFNLDVTNAEHKLSYIYRDKNITINSNLMVNTPYGDNALLDVATYIDIKRRGYTTYEGHATIPKVKNLPELASNYLLEGLKANFNGTSKELLVDLTSNLLTGQYRTTYREKRGVLELHSRGDSVALNRIVPNLPRELSSEMVRVESQTFLNYRDRADSKTDVRVTSNVINLTSSINHAELNRIKFSGTIPPYSVLTTLNDKIDFNALGNISGEVLRDGDFYAIHLNSEGSLNLSVNYNSSLGTLSQGQIQLLNEAFQFSRNELGEITLNSRVEDVQRLFSDINQYYHLSFPPLHGAVNLSVTERSDGKSYIQLSSPNLKYLDTTSNESDAINFKDVELAFSIDREMNIELSKYQFNLDDNGYFNHFYSNKRAYLRVENERLIIESMDLNNQATLSGFYAFDSSTGTIHLTSDAFSYVREEFDLLLGLDLKLKIVGKRLDLEGDVDILGNRVYYELSNSPIIEDSDIIIVQEMQQKSESALKNLKLYLKIKSSKPLEYITKDINIKFFSELSVIKNYDTDVMVTGVSTITDGYYQFEDKKFLLDESHIYLTGNPKKPLLDIKANYIKDQYTVHIFISGSSDEPIVNFNSDPYLKQQEILSLILFDGVGSTGGGAEAYTLLGGTFAKSLMKSLGINVVDHLLLGTDASDNLSLEIGGKISNDITLMYMYQNGENGAKIRMEHSNNFETDIIVKPHASSIEFLYKQNR